MQDMEPEGSSLNLENEQQFWAKLEEIVSKQCDSHELIDDALRAYLGISAEFKGKFLVSEYDVSRCSYELFSSSLFAQHADYIRRQIIYSLLQEDDPDILHFIVSFLLFDGRQNDSTFQLMNEEGSFPRLLELVYSPDINLDNGAGLHRLLMDLLYEMARIQQIKIEDLVLVEDDFVKYLFEIIEGLSNDAHDPYHYPVIRVLLVLNEQFMVSAHDPGSGASLSPLTNKVMKVLSIHGNIYKTFGENIILLLNREGETSLQLLTLKLLYLLFTTPSTYEYFYTNDLRVLVDILIRNLLDLPEEATALRHTYLRVLYPLLAHTQLKYPPHYKQDEIRKTLGILVHSRIEGSDSDSERIMHFAEADETTKRLVSRCIQVEWLRDPEPKPRDSPGIINQTVELPNIMGFSISSDMPHLKDADIVESPISQDSGTTASPTKPEPLSPSISSSVDERNPETLGMHLGAAASSTLSVLEVAAHKEKPGVMTPSLRDKVFHESIVSTKTKQKPLPPKTRRSRDHHNHNHDGRGRPVVVVEHNSPTTPESHSPAEVALLVPKSSTSRSTSRPAPALPPPRRSVHHTSISTAASTAHPPLPTTKSSVKPEPPKTRRWRHGVKSSAEISPDEVERAASPASTTGSLPQKDSDDSMP